MNIKSLDTYCRDFYSIPKYTIMDKGEVIQSFKQGKRGNCVSIAVIKAAIDQYGLYDVFKGIIKDQDKYMITMKDGFETVLRDHEIEKASRYSKFIKGSDDQILSQAHFYFAAMAKRVYVEGEIDVFLGKHTLRGALRSLNNGENYLEGIKWLGLTNHFRVIQKSELQNHKNVIAASKEHCFFIENGEYIDNYGTPMKITNSNTRGAFKLDNLISLI